MGQTVENQLAQTRRGTKIPKNVQFHCLLQVQRPDIVAEQYVSLCFVPPIPLAHARERGKEN